MIRNGVLIQFFAQKLSDNSEFAQLSCVISTFPIIIHIRWMPFLPAACELTSRDA
jgi:hypothetical protein